MALADVAVGSHGVGDEFDIDPEVLVGGPGHRRCRPAERRRGGAKAAALQRGCREGQHCIERSAPAQPEFQLVLLSCNQLLATATPVGYE